MRLQGMRQYLAESWSELKKVAWPTRETVLRLTVIVLIVGTLVGAYIALLDIGLKNAVDQIL